MPSKEMADRWMSTLGKIRGTTQVESGQVLSANPPDSSGNWVAVGTGTNNTLGGGKNPSLVKTDATIWEQKPAAAAPAAATPAAAAPTAATPVSVSNPAANANIPEAKARASQANTELNGESRTFGAITGLADSDVAAAADYGSGTRRGFTDRFVYGKGRNDATTSSDSSSTKRTTASAASSSSQDTSDVMNRWTKSLSSPFA